MSKKIRRKRILLFATEIICLILLGIFLFSMQSGLSMDNQERDTNVKLAQMQDLVASADEDTKQTTAIYDALYQSKADSLSFIAQNQVAYEPSNLKMQEYRDLLDVTNVLVLDREGNQVAKAQNTEADFTFARFNQLRTVFTSQKLPAAMEVDFGEEAYRYYASPIDDQHMFVVEQDAAELKEEVSGTATWEGIVGNVSVGLDGYTFAISDQDYTFLYHPDEDLVGTDALDAGIPVDALEDDAHTWLTINGERFYSGITHTDKHAYIICAISEDEIHSSSYVTVGVILFIIFALMTIIITYGIFVWNEEEQNSKKDENLKPAGTFFYNKAIGKKAAALSVIGLVLVFAITFYMQTLFSLSRQAMSNNQRTAEVENTIEENEATIAQLTEQYNKQYLSKARVAAYVMDNKPELGTRESLAVLRDVLQIKNINIFDAGGEEIASSAPFTPFHLSSNPEDQSYEFNKLLNGSEYVIQEAQIDDKQEYTQYIGVAFSDGSGFVQLAIRPSRLETMLANTDIVHLLDGVKVGAEGFAFAVNKEDHTFAYYPKEKLIGRDAAAYGMEEAEFSDDYCDYITVDNGTYYGSSLETDHYYIYVVVPEGEMNQERTPITLASTGACLLILILLFILLTFSRKGEEPVVTDETTGDDGHSIDVQMPDGRMAKTDSADSRWSNFSLSWSEETAEQKLSTVIKILFGIMAAAICFAVLFKDRFFDSSSVIRYVLSGKWERGVNIFAITGCIFITCVISIAAMLLKKLLKMLSKTFGARGATICRLAMSFLKYISVIAILYYCFALFGVDTKTLLASAGILSLIIGLGAKTLVSDILAGLFIIFEGEFRVGDIITIGDWRGTVVEIGIRTTKIEDGNKNVKIISNSNVSGVINMTKRFSYAFCDVGIEYGESLERVENILAKEFPNIKRRIPAIQDGPFYKGVVSLGDNSVNIRIMAQCAEGDRIQLMRDLNREMKLIFDKYDINIPFPQIVLNQPTEYIKASAWEKMKADRFNEEQKEASKGLANDEEER